VTVRATTPAGTQAELAAATLPRRYRRMLIFACENDLYNEYAECGGASEDRRRFSEWVLAGRVVDRGELDCIEQELVTGMNAAVEFAIKAPYPDPDKVEQDVYA
jgi:hypothetical protein